MAMPELALQTYHELAGALMRPEAGWQVPAGYGSIDAEVRAVRARTGVLDLSDRAKIEVTGSERVPFLDGLVTADIKVLSPGKSAYALLLNEKSRVLADVRMYAFPESLILDVEAAQKDAVLRILEKARVSDDVEFRDLGPTGHLLVLGPAADDAVARAVGLDAHGLTLDAFTRFAIDRRRSGVVARLRPVGETGFAIWSAGSTLAGVWEALAARGTTPIGRDAWEVVRIEAGVPRLGADMGEDTLALEVAPEGSLNFAKGCYVGQEVVARGTYVGQVRRKLFGLAVEGDIPPERRDRVSSGGRDIGFVTSGVWSPTLASAISLAILRVDDASRDEPMLVDRGGWLVRAQPRPLPFVRTSP